MGDTIIVLIVNRNRRWAVFLEATDGYLTLCRSIPKKSRSYKSFRVKSRHRRSGGPTVAARNMRATSAMTYIINSPLRPC